MAEFYHLLNRGVDKRKIFLDNQDYLRCIHDLFEFNDIQNVNPNNYRFFQPSQLLDIGCPTVERRPRKLLVNIYFFSLMPNHYHLLVSPIAEDGISRFMKKLNMGYAKYFNEKYDRSGALFQGKYRSARVQQDAHFLWIPYYIHFNPLDLQMPEWRDNKIRNPKKAFEYLESYRWSSHIDYLGRKNFPSITQREFFLEMFGGTKEYTRSMKKYLYDFNFDEIKETTLE